MIFEKPDVVMKDWDLKQVYLFSDKAWSSSPNDRVRVAMRSGKTLECSILEVEPIYQGRCDGELVQTVFRYKLIWKAVLKPERYL